MKYHRNEPGYYSNKPVKNKKHKSPVGASMLSFLCIPGSGQFYIGRHAKGAIFLIAGLIIAFADIGRLWALLMLIIRLWSGIDAYYDAKRVNEEMDHPQNYKFP